jgi:hypothetical protein
MTQHKELPLFLRRLARPPQHHPHLTPGCPFGAARAPRPQAVEQGRSEPRGRCLWLVLWLSGAVAAEVGLRLVRG